MIKQILEVLKPYVWSVEETGSCILPYIKNSHDKDIVIITKTWEDRAAASKLYRSAFSLEERRQLKKRDNISPKMISLISPSWNPCLSISGNGA